MPKKEYKQSKWISVDDLLPDEGKEVMCYSPINHWNSEESIFICTRDRYLEDNGKWSSYCVWFFQFDGGDGSSEVDPTITHWMPIPDAPEGD